MDVLEIEINNGTLFWWTVLAGEVSTIVRLHRPLRRKCATILGLFVLEFCSLLSCFTYKHIRTSTFGFVFGKCLAKCVLQHFYLTRNHGFSLRLVVLLLPFSDWQEHLKSVFSAREVTLKVKKSANLYNAFKLLKALLSEY